MNKSSMAAAVVFGCLALGACGGGDDDDDVALEVPERPGELSGLIVAGGAHLTWLDESDDETEFVIERQDGLDGDYAEVGREPADSTEHRDRPLAAGTHWYRVSATNAAGTSPPSNEVIVEMP